MRQLVYFFLFLFLSCQSQVGVNKALPQKQISFEDKNHYPFTLTSKSFLIISSQEKMDEVFSIIHEKNSGNRFSPIPAIVEDETYLICKPFLKNSNDVSIDSVILDNNKLFIKVSEFQNPNIDENSRVSPNILLKLNEKLTVKDVIIKY